MRSVTRRDAKQWVAEVKIARLSPNERAQTLEAWWSLDSEDEEWFELPEALREELDARNEAPSDATSPRYDPLLRLAVLQEMRGVLNSWLQKTLDEVSGADGTIVVVGEPEKLLECVCCGYLSIPKRGEYEICPVCFWEDDGLRELDRVSGPNHMTLREARASFAQLGACCEDAARHVRPESRNMYPHADDVLRSHGRAAEDVDAISNLLAAVEANDLVRTVRLMKERPATGEVCAAAASSIERSQTEMLSVLLRNGADPNARLPGMNWTLLHLAVEHQNAAALTLLLEHGADVESVDDSGCTALHHAIDTEADAAHQAGQAPVPTLTRLLLDAGADPHAKDSRGKTPLEIARDYDYAAAVAEMEGRSVR